ncbi:MAG: ABC transporter ATP-binding protein [Acetobacter aceti]|uniref:ABC transporter ATP-binding protein n=1 Tax=Acetobacter aceti TaxID=435 RepID=A0A1U9KDK5_ACEAC|nr:ABC transporter ATP-binding protein [Acetobacter aceti]AQS83838.1 ABC transporter ATP-binding protein [Acetobacter aceti]
MTPFLDVRNIGKSFHGVPIIKNFSLSVEQGSATALIGPNGAGKTTVFNLLCGLYPLDSGEIFIDGKEISKVPKERRIRHGLVRSFQNIRLVDHLSVLDNLLIGAYIRTPGPRTLLTPFRLQPRNAVSRQVREKLDALGLAHIADSPAGRLPYGLRKRIDLLRATLTGARLILLDEPAAGLNPSETHALMRQLRALKENGATLLVVEHDMHFVSSLCDQAVVLNFGECLARGTPSAVMREPAVKTAYLGTAYERAQP